MASSIFSPSVPHSCTCKHFLSKSMLQVIEERERQINEEGFTREDDAQYFDNELPRAAASYLFGRLLPDGPTRFPPTYWPFENKWWKPQSRRRDLVRAAALIIAELEAMEMQGYEKPHKLTEKDFRPEEWAERVSA